MTNKIIPYEKSFASHEKAQFWSDKNELKPNEVLIGTGKKFWFNCVCGHEFEKIINNINKSWCPYCSNPAKNLCDKENCNQCFEKSFASHEKAQFWSDKNELKPREIFRSSHEKFYFNCNDCNHEFLADLHSINSGRWCSYCAHQQLCDNNECKECFNQSFASHEKAQYWSDKNEVKAVEVFKSSRKKYIFRCNICSHDFFSSLCHIINGSWCPYCCEPSRLLCDNNKCKKCFEKSFASHEKAKYWSNKNKLCPTEVFKSSGDKYIFDCNICKHEFIAKLNNIYSGNRWCPYCAKPCKKLCENNECKYCFDKSFASHEKSIEFSLKNNINPRQIIKGSHEKYLFDCKMCNHEYETIIGSDNWCIYCSSKKLCNNDKCIFCFKKSFESHEKSKYLNDKTLDTRFIFKGTADKYNFNCNKCNKIFLIAINKITGSNRWCPYCVNKTEQKLYDKLLTLYFTLQQQFRVDWCKNKTYLPFDFVIPENKIIIELDGIQHFEQVSNWDSPDKVQERDKYKMICANDNNYSVIRILQEDVFYDTYDWLSELNDNIKDIIKNKKVQNIYMCKDNEYDIFN